MKILYLLISLIWFNTAAAQDEFELVQSVPVETFMEQSSLPRTYDVWLKMINDAKNTIDIETFYFANEKGEPLDDIMNSLKSAAGRGVMIRIIVDSSFYSNNDKSVDELEGIENIRIRKIPMGNIYGGVMHAKYFIVDDENVFVGSQNMDWRAIKHIHEIGARVKNGALAETFKEIFENDWKLSDPSKEESARQSAERFINSSAPVIISDPEYGDVIIYPAFSPPEKNFPSLSTEEEELIKIINASKNSLLIQMYSYSPKGRNEIKFYGAIDTALRNAAGRGVNIKMILSDWSIRDAATQFIKDLSGVNGVEIKFSTIPQFSGGFIPYSRVEHCKYFVADENISWISTSNWEMGYFRNSRDVTLIIDNKKVNLDLTGIFMSDWNGPYTTFVDVNKDYKPVKRN